MQRIKTSALLGSLLLAAITGFGCSSSGQQGRMASDHPGFQGGNGAFGEDPGLAGTYSHSNGQTANHRLTRDENSGFQGGNGAFGEDPAGPGRYDRPNTERR